MMIDQFVHFMPDEWTNVRKVDRAYFWNVFSTLAHDFVCDLVKDVNDLRHEAMEQRRKDAEPSEDEDSKIRPSKSLAKLLLRKNPKQCKYSFHFHFCHYFMMTDRPTLQASCQSTS